MIIHILVHGLFHDKVCFFMILEVNLRGEVCYYKFTFPKFNSAEGSPPLCQHTVYHNFQLGVWSVMYVVDPIIPY